MRRASVEHIEKLYQSKADQARERRVSLTIMNCIWARNTERETTHPVHGEVIGKLLILEFRVTSDFIDIRHRWFNLMIIVINYNDVSKLISIQNGFFMHQFAKIVRL